MKTLLRAFFILILSWASAQAETVYVADDLNLSLRNEANAQSKILQSLPTGAPLTVIDKPKKSEFIHVRLLDGSEGYINSRYTKKQAPAVNPKDNAGKTLTLVQSENAALRAELATLKEAVTPGSSLEKSLAIERDQLARELNEIKKTAGSSIQLKNERDELQERVVNVERELQQFKLENQVLKDTAGQDWFLYGGLLSLAGVLLGFILPKLGWRHKSSWDSF